MKGIVIYKGRYGATRQYAAWIGQELQITVASADHFPVSELSNYDFFIVGSSVYIGKMEISKWLKQHLTILSDRKLYLFQVAASPVEEKEKRESYNNASVPPAILSKSETYFFPGRMIMRNLSWLDKFMLRMGARLTKDPVEKKRMLTDFDHVKKEHTKPLINSVKNYISMRQPALAI